MPRAAVEMVVVVMAAAMAAAAMVAVTAAEAMAARVLDKPRPLQEPECTQRPGSCPAE